MKRLASIAVLGTAALLLPSLLIAQRGMSGRGGGGGGFRSSGAGGFRSAGPGGFRSAGPGGFRSGPPAGFRSGPPSGFRTGPPGGFRTVAPGGFRTVGPGGFRPGGPGVRTFAPGPRTTNGFVRFGSAGRPVARPFGPGGHGFNNGFNHFHHNRVFFNNCFGFSCGSPFFFGGGFGFGFGAGAFFGSPFFGLPFYGPPYYPYYPGDYYGYGPQPQSQPVVVSTDNGNTVQLSADVQRLSDEVADLRNEESRRYSEDRAAASSGASLSAKEPAVTVFIFRDGRRFSAQSYAITGQTLWIFDEHAARKFLIADLDFAATERANAANGVEFRVPESPVKR
jgi:hypothetical protein